MAAIADSPAARRGGRIPFIDLVRGVAILAMIVYHGAWDLSAEGLIAVNVMENPGWVAFARLIAGTFLALVGVNLVLAARNGPNWAAFLRRLAVIIGAAALVTIATWQFFPDAFVFFGILHCIAAASVLALPFLRAPVALIALAALFFLAAPHFLTSPVFDAPGWLWLGLSERLPTTVDYVPIFPWFGVVLGGVIVGRLIEARGLGPAGAWRPSGPAGRSVVFAGQWSLPIYLIHQPVLIGLLLFGSSLLGSGAAERADEFRTQCVLSCATVGHDQPTCQAYCSCAVSRFAENNGLLTPAAEAECRVRHLPPPVLDGAT